MAFTIYRWSVLGFLAVLALPASLLAQQEAQAQIRLGGLNPDSFYGKDTQGNVTVRDSLEAIKQLEDARNKERQQDWEDAADRYQSVIEKFGQYVVPSAIDSQKRIYQYTGIERPVQEQLANWPVEGQNVYRNRYGAVARAMLNQASRDDIETLSRVMRIYFVTDAAKEAGLRLVDLLLEGGIFPEAARIGDRLLNWHPNLKVERPRVLFRTALAYHLAGDSKRAALLQKELIAKFPDATGTLYGKDVILTDALRQLLQHTPPVAAAGNLSAVRLNPGGNEERSLMLGAGGRPGARLASIELSPPPTMNAQQRQIYEARGGGALASPNDPAVMPVVDGDQLFFQDGSRVYAVSVASGVPLPGWMQTYPNSSGQYTVSNVSLGGKAQHTLTLTESSVLAVMGVSQRQPGVGGELGTRLVCLNRADGRERWIIKPNQIKLPEGAPAQPQTSGMVENAVRSLEFSGSPLIVGDSVYVIGRGGKSVNSEDCYVLCFDINNGAYKWACFVASAATSYGYYGGGPVTQDTLSHLAFSSGRVYALTNLGALAAIDAYGGTVVWLNIYPRETPTQDPQMGWSRGRPNNSNIRPWEFNPVIVFEGRIFILPTDGRQHLMIYDASSGAEIKRIAVADFKAADDPQGPSAILAVDRREYFLAESGPNHFFARHFGESRSEIYLTGGNYIYCIDWQLYTPGRPTNPAEDPACLVWKTPFTRNPPTSSYDGCKIRGRGWVTADSVYVCNEQYLHRIDRRTGKLTPDVYPAWEREWDKKEEDAGNVVVVGDNVIVAGPRRVNVYADVKLARKKLDDDVAAAPTEAGPRLRYAEVMFVAGQLPVTMEKLHEVVQLLGGIDSLRVGTERSHLFGDCLTFAAKTLKDRRPEEAAQLAAAVDPLYELAAAAAYNDSQQVNYRLSRARFNFNFEREGSMERAVTLYQQILSNPRLRIVPLLDEEAGGATQAGNVAERAINDVRTKKPGAYDAVEKRAAQALADAGNDPALLKAVAECYPNSKSAPRAMITAAQAYEDNGNNRLAAHTLRLVYNKYSQDSDQIQVSEGLARNFLATPDPTGGRIDAAVARLAAIVYKSNAGSRTLSKPLVLSDGKVLAPAGATFTIALKQVQGFKSRASAAKLADFAIQPADTEDDRTAYIAAHKAWETNGRQGPEPRLQKPPFAPADQHVVVAQVQAIVAPPPELRAQHSRHDRLVVWQGDALALYAVGAPQPLAQSKAIAQQATGLAWLDSGKALLAWGEGDIALLGGEKLDKRWASSIKNLADIDVVASALADQNIGEQRPGLAANDQVFINGGVVINRAVGIRRGRLPAAKLPPTSNSNAEQVLWVRPMGDRILIATSTARLFALKLSDGSLVWQTRLAKAVPIERMLASDDFVVCKLTDSANTQIIVLDTINGQLVRRLNFLNESGNVPVNLALAPDGMLVWTMADRLCGKDLFEPRKDLTYQTVAGQEASANPRFNNTGNGIFSGAVHPDQLLISEGRILAVSHNGMFVSIYSLESGKLLDYKQEDGRKADARLSTVAGLKTISVNDWSVSLNVLGQFLYVVSRDNGPVCYDLNLGGQRWNGAPLNNPDTMGEAVPSRHQDVLFGQDYIAIFGTPTSRALAAAAPANTVLRMAAYSRRPPKDEPNGESGKLGHTFDLKDPAGILDYEGVDGGLYYLAGDNKLHFLKGARQ